MRAKELKEEEEGKGESGLALSLCAVDTVDISSFQLVFKAWASPAMLSRHRCSFSLCVRTTIAATPSGIAGKGARPPTVFFKVTENDSAILKTGFVFFRELNATIDNAQESAKCERGRTSRCRSYPRLRWLHILTTQSISKWRL